jgi:SAM-dependent methyltransferase
MLGQETAALESRPRNWLQRIWGVPDIHARQKWAAIWPHLAGLPSGGLRVLDAGCGDGQWALELAARRPGWLVVGLDRSADAIARAEAARRRLQLPNAEFVVADFREAAFASKFDVVLSVASSHYLAATGDGLRLFRTFAEWLRPEGLLCLLGPRSDGTDPFSPRLPHPAWHPVFSREELEALCRGAGLRIDRLAGCIGNAGILAKQLAWAASERSNAVRALLYPVEWAMTMADQGGSDRPDRPTLMWLLTARREQ